MADGTYAALREENPISWNFLCIRRKIKMAKIKLSQIRKEDYEQAAAEISERLRQQEPRVLGLDLGLFFKNKSGIFEARLWPYAAKWNSNCIGFEVDTDAEDEERFKEILKTGVPNLEKIASEGRVWPSEEEIHQTSHPFMSTTGIRYALTYHPDSNLISTSSLYSGHYANQKVLTWFFDTIGHVVDFEDLSALKMEAVNEDNTENLFDELAAKTRDYKELAQAFKLEYKRSPFMRLLYGQGFKDMTIIALRDEVMDLIGRRAEELKVKVKDFSEGGD
jgi:hypothetical protein